MCLVSEMPLKRKQISPVLYCAEYLWNEVWR